MNIKFSFSLVVTLINLLVFLGTFLFFYHEVFQEADIHKPIIGPRPKIEFLTKDGKLNLVSAKTDTGADRSTLDKTVAKKLGLNITPIGYVKTKTQGLVERRPIISAVFYVEGIKVNTKMSLSNRTGFSTQMLLGKRDLNTFLLDLSLDNTNSVEKKFQIETIQIVFLLSILSTIIVFFRQIVGLKTYGLFAPLIIALSFVSLGIMKSITLYSFLIGVGLGANKLFEKFGFLHTSKISANLFVLSLSLLFFSTFLNIQPENGALTISLPFILITHIIEKFNKTWENYDFKEALKLLVNTFFVTALSFMVLDKILFINNDVILIISFVVSFLFNVLFSFYSGSRLLELGRFAKTEPLKKIYYFFSSPFLGMNYRNMKIINQINPKKAIRLVNDKAKFKKLLISNKVPTSKLLGEIKTINDLKFLKTLKPPFVIKPSRGSAGNGILLISEKKKDVFITRSGKKLSQKNIEKFIKDILEGVYSLDLEKDTALIESMIIPHKNLKRFSKQGVPDIRLITYKNKIIAAMMRIPTLKSGGKANISKGALAAKIDMNTGRIETIYNKMAKTPLRNLEKKEQFKLPDWQKVKEISLKAANLTGLGYVGVDIIYDNKEGPLIVECNARPGLEIQNVTRTGLFEKINEIDKQKHKTKPKTLNKEGIK